MVLYVHYNCYKLFLKINHNGFYLIKVGVELNSDEEK